MGEGGLAAWLVSVLLVSLRVAPVFAFAPPFTLTRVPATFRMLFGLGISAALVGAFPGAAAMGELSTGLLVQAAARELLLGMVFVLVFQLMFAALYLAGRTVDIQAGFGLATLIDPTSRNQTPLVGTLFAFAAAWVFFGLDGHLDLLAVMGASMSAVPVGAALPPASLARLMEFIAAVFAVGLGVGGGAILAMFLADLAITLLSRTVPQMNVLVLGFQVKTLLLLLVLPATFGAAGALLARMARLTLEAMLGVL